jgi:hypothetical protein
MKRKHFVPVSLVIMIFICSIAMAQQRMQVKPKFSKAYVRGYMEGCLSLGGTREQCNERIKIRPLKRDTRMEASPMLTPTAIVSEYFFGCYDACRADGRSPEYCNLRCYRLEQLEKQQEEKPKE